MVVAAIDVDVDAVDDVDRVPEPLEVDRDRVVDAEPVAGRAQQLLDRARRQIQPALPVGGVDLVDAVAGDRHAQVARDRQHGRRALLRVEPDQHQRVRVRVTARIAVAPIGADQQQRLRLAGRRRRDRPAPERLDVPVVAHDAGDVVDLHHADADRRARHREDDDGAAIGNPSRIREAPPSPGSDSASIRTQARGCRPGSGSPRDRRRWPAGPVRKWDPPATVSSTSAAARRGVEGPETSSPARSALSCHPPEERLRPRLGLVAGGARECSVHARKGALRRECSVHTRRAASTVRSTLGAQQRRGR